MKYEQYTKAGPQIGSGPVEGSCKNVIATRMKKPGARWSKDGANGMLARRCTLL